MSLSLRNITRRLDTFGISVLRKTYSRKASKRYPRRVFSGIQPTGKVHLGNYLGAIQRWIQLQDSEESTIWSIVDMHSITLAQNPEALRSNILELTATLLACGIDPNKSILFQQSSVPMHVQLHWVLSCISTMTRLGHLPQYKEKSASLKVIPLGLFLYPVLQAADILIYRATHVPVGEDQAQHIQLAQDLAESFNSKFGDTFPIPHSMISNDSGQRIKSLRQPQKKMSKSDTDPKGCLNITADPDELYLKIKRAVTDCISKVEYDPVERPGVANLISIHSLLSGKPIDEICTEAEGIETGKYKLVVADVVIDKLRPIREEYLRLIKDPAYIEGVLSDGCEKATKIAATCWQDVAKSVGFECKVPVASVVPQTAYNK